MENLTFIGPVVFPLQIPFSLKTMGLIGVTLIYLSVYLKRKALKELPPQMKWERNLAIAFLMSIGLILFGSGGVQSHLNNFHSYVFDDRGISIFDMSKTDERSADHLVKQADYTDLTPYFWRKTLYRSDAEDEIVVGIHFKLNDGIIFLTMRDQELDQVALQYVSLHEKAPFLLNRMVIEAGAEEDFLQFKEVLMNQTN